MNQVEQFHADRRTGIGGSDIGAICGVNPFRGKMEVYLEKVGAIESAEPNEAMLWGTILEPVIVKQFCERHNARIEVGIPMARMEGHPHIIFHADGLILDHEDKPMALFEAKTSGAFARTTFGPSGTSEVPPSYNLQVQQGMAVFDLPRAFMAVLIGGQDFRVFEIMRDDELIADMIMVADNFWPCVVNREPPDIDGSKDSARYLEVLYPQDSGAEIRADSYAIEWVGRLRQARKAIAKGEADELLARNKIVDHMEKATYLIGPGFKITHKKAKDRKTTKWMNVARELNAPQDLIDSHTMLSVSHRRFTPVWKDA